MTLAARLILVVVFAVAGAAKLHDRDGSREAARGFGVPDRLAGFVGTVLPLAELAVAALLLVPATARAGAIGALVLLAAFVIAIAAAMARGEAPDCHCFGALHSEPAGARTLARNVVLAAVAVIPIVRSPGPTAWGWIGGLDTTQTWLLIAVVVFSVALVAQGAFVLALLRQNGRILRRIDALEAAGGLPAAGPAWDSGGYGLAIGLPAPGFDLTALDGIPVTLDQLRAPGRPVVLLFTDPDCAPCAALMPEVGDWQREHGDQLTIAVISRGDPVANRAKTAAPGVGRVLLQRDREVAEAFNCPLTPTALAIGADGRVLLPAAPGAEAIRLLVATALAEASGPTPALHVEPPAPPALAIGSAAPALTLTDLDGDPIDLTDPRSGGRVLVFWNPGCGFCSQMLDDLRAAERAAGPGAPELILVSTGTAEENRAMGLRARIALNPGFTVGAAFGASGTPSAILLDDRGHVAAPLGLGAPAVLALTADGSARR